MDGRPRHPQRHRLTRHRCTSGRWRCGTAASPGPGQLRRPHRRPPPPGRPWPLRRSRRRRIGHRERFLTGTLTICAYLAEVRSLVPQEESAWGLITDLEIDALTDAGNLPAATRLAQDLLQQDLRRTDADPGNAGWQRDLSVSHDKARGPGRRRRRPDRRPRRLHGRPHHHPAAGRRRPRQRRLATRPVRQPRQVGDLAVAAGDLTAARDAYNASLTITQRLADADPGNAGWQRDLSVSHEQDRRPGRRRRRPDRRPRRLHRLPQHPPAAGRRRPRQRRLATRPVRQPRQDRRPGRRRRRPDRRPRRLQRRPHHRPAAGRRRPRQRRLATRPRPSATTKLGDLAVAAGDLTAARDAYTAALTIAQRLADADPGNAGWQRDLSVSHDKLGDLAVAAGDLTAARDRLHRDPHHRPAAGRRRPRQRRLATRPVRQPDENRERRDERRGP